MTSVIRAGCGTTAHGQVQVGALLRVGGHPGSAASRRCLTSHGFSRRLNAYGRITATRPRCRPPPEHENGGFMPFPQHRSTAITAVAERMTARSQD